MENAWGDASAPLPLLRSANLLYVSFMGNTAQVNYHIYALRSP